MSSEGKFFSTMKTSAQHLFRKQTRFSETITCLGSNNGSMMQTSVHNENVFHRWKSKHGNNLWFDNFSKGTENTVFWPWFKWNPQHQEPSDLHPFRRSILREPDNP